MNIAALFIRRPVATTLRSLAGRHRVVLLTKGDGEVELVGAVMEATPTLTVGTVTVGPHA